MKSSEFFNVLSKFAPRTAELEEVDVKFILNNKEGVHAIVSIVYDIKEFGHIHRWLKSKDFPFKVKTIEEIGCEIKDLGWKINDFGENNRYHKLKFKIKPTSGE